MSESYERTLTRIIENQREILSELKVIKDKVRRIENRLNDLEQKMDNSFDITNYKVLKEDTIKGAAKALIKKEQGNKCKNNSNYSDKVNKRPKVSCDFTNLILKITELVDLDLEEVQEAKKDPEK
ncbi:13004_t:CDS:2, partial [Gigaspora margarita]